MVDRDLVIAKMATIDRCLQRISDVRGQRGAALLPLDVEDIVVLNLQRGVQAAVDLANHVVATEGYGLPDSLAAAFTLLEVQGVIDSGLADRMRRMVGFRNIAVHEDQALNPAVVDAIVERHLTDLQTFTSVLTARFLPPA